VHLQGGIVVASVRQIVLPSCALAVTLVLGASAGWSGPASSVLAALVAIMVAVISTMVTVSPDARDAPRDR
jgi:hypothetical protein